MKERKLISKRVVAMGGVLLGVTLSAAPTGVHAQSVGEGKDGGVKTQIAKKRQANIQPEAKLALQRLLKRYSTLRSYSGSIVLRSNLKSREMDHLANVKLQRPQKFRLYSVHLSNGATLRTMAISDGREYYNLTSRQPLEYQRVKIQDDTDALRSALMETGLDDSAIMTLFYGRLTLDNLINQDSLVSLVLEEAYPPNGRPLKKLKFQYDPQGAPKGKEQAELTMLMDGKSGALLQVSMNSVESGKPYQVVETYTNTQLNAPVPASAFEIKVHLRCQAARKAAT